MVYVCLNLNFFGRGAASVTQGRMFGLIPEERIALYRPHCTGSEKQLTHCDKEEGGAIKPEQISSVVAGELFKI